MPKMSALVQLESLSQGHAILTQLLDLKKSSVSLKVYGPQGGQVFQ